MIVNVVVSVEDGYLSKVDDVLTNRGFVVSHIMSDIGVIAGSMPQSECHRLNDVLVC